MKFSYPIKLTVPNKVEYLPIIEKAVSAMAHSIGFGKMDIAKIDLGLEEAIVNILNTAFLPGEETTYEIILQPQTTGLKIVLKEKGIPFASFVSAGQWAGMLKTNRQHVGANQEALRNCRAFAGLNRKPGGT